jgi:hypothetical protein
VIAEIVENPEVSRGKDELDAVFDRLRFDRAVASPGVDPTAALFGPAKDVIPASGERIRPRLLIHGQSPPQQDSHIQRPAAGIIIKD